MSNLIRCLLASVALCAFPTAVLTEMPNTRDVAVTIDRNGDRFAVKVGLAVDATPEEVFAVLTDYDHMARFVSNVLESRIVGRDGNKIAVEQKSRLALGPIHFDFANVRDVELVPFREIRSRVTAGDMQGSSFTATLAAHGAQTWIDNRGCFVSNRWIPPIIGTALLEAETRKQFQEFRNEILRRKGAAADGR
jgi:carbon monoxide dehydrogenase subunit G